MSASVKALLRVGGAPTVYMERTTSIDQESPVMAHLANGRRPAAMVSRGRRERRTSSGGG
jgi:hypothetical protein